MSTPDELTALAERVLDLVQGDEAIVTVTRQDHGLTRFANSFIHQHVGDLSSAVSLTVARDGRVSTSHTTDVTDDGLRALAANAAATADLLPVDTTWPGVAGPTAAATRNLDATPGQADQRARIVADFVAAGDGMMSAGYCDTATVTQVLATSAGARLVGTSNRATLDGIQQATDGDHRAAGTAHQTHQSAEALDGATAGARAADLATRGLQRVDLEPGRYPVVLGPECAATIALFLSVYGFNAKAHAEGQSGIHLGQRQFDESISLVDDPTAADAFGFGFDDEGTPQAPLTLIGAGVSSNLAHDRRTAAAAGTESTGHGGPGSATWGPVAGQLRLLPGGRPSDDLVADLDRGLLVTAFNYCRVLDPKTLVVTGLTRNGTFLVEYGQVVGAVGNVRFTQSFLEALGPDAVVGVGADARWADSEFGPALAHAPSLALRSWHVSGAAAS